MTQIDELKAMSARLRKRLEAADIHVTHSQGLELIAAALGFRDWNTCVATEWQPPTVPILRTFPGPEAERFYVDFLGFEVEWEHRFEPGMPLYRQVVRGETVLHLSEHHGDATPGSAVRLRVDDVRDLQARLEASSVYPLRIGLSEEEWGTELAVPDPFDNRLVFHTPAG